MLKSIIYFSSYFFVLFVILRLSLNKQRRMSDVLFLIGVSLIPIGKLFYLPIPGLVSVKAAFIFTSVVGGTSLLLSFIKGAQRFALLPFIFCIPALLSLIFLYPPSQASFVAAPADVAEGGSTLLRLISVFLTSAYCSYTIVYVSKNDGAERDIATYYIVATLFATVIGAFIFYGIFFGQLSRADVVPVSVQEVHIVGRLFRFNPGANVNEFGQIVGYALLMLRWTGWRTHWKLLAAVLLLIAETLSLTRGAWVGLVVAYLLYAVFTDSKQRTRLIVTGGLAFALVLVVALNWHLLDAVLASRTSLGASAGGNARLVTASAVIQALTSSPLRLFFGFGWSADIFSSSFGFGDISYIHSVPLMMLFDTGIVGVAICLVAFVAIGRFVYANIRQDFDIIIGLMSFMFTVSLFEHNFFHVQTWLIVGLVMGMALRSSLAEHAQHASIPGPIPSLR